MTHHLPRVRPQVWTPAVLAPCDTGPFTIQHTPQCITARIARQDQP